MDATLWSIIGSVAVVVGIPTLAVAFIAPPAKRQRAQGRERRGRPRAMLVGGPRTHGETWITQRVAIWNDGGHDLTIAKVEVLSFPFMFIEPRGPQDVSRIGHSIGIMDLAARALCAGAATEVRFVGSGGRIVLKHEKAPGAFLVFVPAPHTRHGRLLPATHVDPQFLFNLVLRLHYEDGTTQEILVADQRKAMNVDALDGDFAQVACSTTTAYSSPFVLPAGTAYARWRDVGDEWEYVGDGKL